MLGPRAEQVTHTKNMACFRASLSGGSLPGRQTRHFIKKLRSIAAHFRLPQQLLVSSAGPQREASSIPPIPPGPAPLPGKPSLFYPFHQATMACLFGLSGLGTGYLAPG